ncbi:MAG: P-II family nitrogen regulator [Desulfitobacteriaceae bacterium]
MAENEAIKRVEIIIEALESQKALAMIERAGATGYTVIPHVYGKGHRGIRTELGFSDVLKNVMIIVISRETVAEQIARDVGRLFERCAGLLTVTAVESCYGFNK